MKALAGGVLLLAAGLLAGLVPPASALGALEAGGDAEAHGGDIVAFQQRLRLDDADSTHLLVRFAEGAPAGAEAALVAPDASPTAWTHLPAEGLRLDASAAAAWRGHARVADLHVRFVAPNGPAQAEFALDVADDAGVGVRFPLRLRLTPVTVDAQVEEDADGYRIRVTFTRTPDALVDDRGFAWVRDGDSFVTRVPKAVANVTVHASFPGGGALEATLPLADREETPSNASGTGSGVPAAEPKGVPGVGTALLVALLGAGVAMGRGRGRLS